MDELELRVRPVAVSLLHGAGMWLLSGNGALVVPATSVWGVAALLFATLGTLLVFVMPGPQGPSWPSLVRPMNR